MNFMGVKVGDVVHVKLAMSIYNILDIRMNVVEANETQIVAILDDLEDMEHRCFVFNKSDGIACAVPKKYKKAQSWIMRYDTDVDRREFR